MTRTPCSDFVEGRNAASSVSNDGCLSTHHGFLPPKAPAARLPESHCAWDDAVRRVPQLFWSPDTRAFLDQLPLLPSDEASLPDAALPRAATVLSILASAYWRHGLDRSFGVRTRLDDDHLPAPVLQPWIQVNQRLGRGDRPFQSTSDLFLNNFRLRTGAAPDGSYRLQDIAIEHLDVLVPSFGNEPERIFYMSFVEIHAIAGDIITDICRIEEAIVHDQPASICESLERIERCLRRCTETIKKIQPLPSKKTYCDPVLWAKTVAIFAVPPTSYVQGGTSGTSTPFLFLMDALLSRDRYGSYYGKYARQEGYALLPRLHQRFTELVRGIPLKPFIVSKQAHEPSAFAQMAKAYNRVIEAYAGAGGFLDKHVAKVFNYLGVATLVGRNQSTSGHERYVNAETWASVANELRIAMEERIDWVGAPHVESAPSEPLLAAPSLPSYSSTEVARHHTACDAWIIIDGLVFDITRFLERHPGGSAILHSYLGRDVTRPFSQVSGHTTNAARRMLQALLIGRVDSPAPSESSHRDRSDAVDRLLDDLLRVHGLVALQFHRQDPEPQRTLLRLQSYFHFRKEHLPKILGLLSTLWNIRPDILGLGGVLPDWTSEMRTVDWSDQDLVRRRHFHELAERTLHGSLALLDSLIDVAIAAKEESCMGDELVRPIERAIARWKDLS
jgi:cytochrome b involved in lipid metabolism